MQLAQKNLKGNYVNNWEKKINMPKTVKNKLCNCKWFVVHFNGKLFPPIFHNLSLLKLFSQQNQ